MREAEQSMRKMVKRNRIRFLSIWAAALLLALSVCSLQALASTDNAFYVQDDADLLTDEEEASLAGRLRAISYAHDCDVIVYTTDADVLDQHFDNFCVERYENAGYASDGVQYSIGMAHRTWDLYPVGKCKEALDIEAQEIIYEDVIDYLSAGYFYDAFMLYADDVEYYLDYYAAGGAAGETDAGNTQPVNTTPQQTTPKKRGVSPVGAILSLLGSLGISGSTVSAMKKSNKSVQHASGARSYLVQSSLAGTLQRADKFLNNNIVKTPIAVAVSNASSGRPGGSGGGSSSRPRPTHTHVPTSRPPRSSSGSFRRTGGGGSHGKF